MPSSHHFLTLGVSGNILRRLGEVNAAYQTEIMSGMSDVEAGITFRLEGRPADSSTTESVGLPVFLALVKNLFMVAAGGMKRGCGTTGSFAY